MTEHHFVSLSFQRAIQLRIAIIVVTGITGLTVLGFLAKGLKAFPDSMCPLYANLTVQSGTRNVKISNWGQTSVCRFVIYLYVCVFINAHIWLWIILGSDMGDNYDARTAASRDVSVASPKRHLKSNLANSPAHNTTLFTCQFYDRGSALFLLPFLCTHIVLVVACTFSLILITNGLSAFYSNLRENLKEDVTYLDLQTMKSTGESILIHVPTFYSSVIYGTGFAWLTLLCLIAQVIATLAQIQTSLNHVFPAISVSPALSELGVSPARSLSSVSVSCVSPLKKMTETDIEKTEHPTGGYLPLSETDKEETEHPTGGYLPLSETDKEETEHPTGGYRPLSETNKEETEHPTGGYLPLSETDKEETEQPTGGYLPLSETDREKTESSSIIS